MSMYDTQNPVVLATGRVVGATAVVLGGSLANPKIQAIDNVEAIVTDISISAGTMPINSTVVTYLYKGETLLCPAISNTLLSCTTTAKILTTTQTCANIGEADGYMTIVTLVAMSGTPYTASVTVCPKNQISDNYVSFAGVADNVVFSATVAGAKAPATAATTAMTVVDAAGAAVTVPQSLDCWLSTDATGATPRTVGAQSTFAIGASGAIPFVMTTGIACKVITTAAGLATFSVVETAAGTLYLNVELPNKKIVHQALTFA